MEIPSIEELKEYKREGISCENINIKGIFIPTKEAIERIQKINFFLIKNSLNTRRRYKNIKDKINRSIM